MSVLRARLNDGSSLALSKLDKVYRVEKLSEKGRVDGRSLQDIPLQAGLDVAKREFLKLVKTNGGFSSFQVYKDFQIQGVPLELTEKTGWELCIYVSPNPGSELQSFFKVTSAPLSYEEAQLECFRAGKDIVDRLSKTN